MDLLRTIVTSGLAFWAIVLLIFSFSIEDQLIFWTQRVIAFLLIMAAVGIWTLL